MNNEPFDATTPFRARIATALHVAGVPESESGWDDEDDVPICLRSGYHLTHPEGGGDKVVSIAVLARSSAPEAVRQGERDALTQQVYAALRGAGIEVRVNEYGNLTAVDR